MLRRNGWYSRSPSLPFPKPVAASVVYLHAGSFILARRHYGQALSQTQAATSPAKSRCIELQFEWTEKADAGQRGQLRAIARNLKIANRVHPQCAVTSFSPLASITLSTCTSPSSKKPGCALDFALDFTWQKLAKLSPFGALPCLLVQSSE